MKRTIRQSNTATPQQKSSQALYKPDAETAVPQVEASRPAEHDTPPRL